MSLCANAGLSPSGKRASRTTVGANCRNSYRAAADGYLDCLRRCRERFPALRILSGVELHLQVLHWWRQEGGQAITFASDAHEPAALAAGFADAAGLVGAAGFAAGHDPCGFWNRTTSSQ